MDSENGTVYAGASMPLCGLTVKYHDSLSDTALQQSIGEGKKCQGTTLSHASKTNGSGR
jgi:hypothetical protein